MNTPFYGLEFAVQYRRKDFGHGWRAMAAFDVESIAREYKRDCEGAQRPWEYRVVGKDGMVTEPPRSEEQLCVAAKDLKV
jgi:hypothetical protein